MMNKNMEVDASLINKSDFRAFLQQLGYHLTSNNVEEIVYLADLPVHIKCHKKVQKQEKHKVLNFPLLVARTEEQKHKEDGAGENIRSPLALFRSLELHGHLEPSTNGLNYLKGLMEVINRYDLARKVQSFCSETQKPQQSTRIPAQQRSFPSTSHETKEVTKKALNLMKPGDYVKTKTKGTPTSNDEGTACVKSSEEFIASSSTKRYTHQAVSNDELSPPPAPSTTTENLAVGNEKPPFPLSSSANEGKMAVCGEESSLLLSPSATKEDLAASNEAPSVKAGQNENNIEILPPADQEEGLLNSANGSSCFSYPPIPTPPTDDPEFMHSDDSDSYRMKSVPLGICAILNNERFEKSMDIDNYLEDREGSSVDDENLKEVFASLGFEVISKENLTAKETIDYFQQIANMDHSKYDCFVGCVLSHGCNDGFYGVDGKVVTIDELLHGFKVCSSLKEKPKVFFGQFCRGEKADEIVPDSNTSNNIFKENPSEADFYIAYATPPGYVSWRSKLNGTWFISKLCYWLKRKARELHLDDIMTKVKKDVASSYTSDLYKQVPFVCGTLTKTLKFC